MHINKFGQATIGYIGQDTLVMFALCQNNPIVFGLAFLKLISW